MFGRSMIAIVSIGLAAMLGSCGNADGTGDEAPVSTAVAVEAAAATATDEALATAEQRAVDAEARTVAAEERAAAAEQRATEAEERAATAEDRADAAEERVTTLSRRVSSLRDQRDELRRQLEAAVEQLAADQTTTTTTTTTPATPSDPYLIPSGVIEDGDHVGYLTALGDTWFSFDMAEIQADGSWKNENPKIRTLPVAPSANMLYGALPGTPIELYVANQHVVWVVGLF
jgi:hypothetical protein